MTMEEIPITVYVCGHHYRTEGTALFAEGYSLYVGPDCDIEGCAGE